MIPRLASVLPSSTRMTSHGPSSCAKSATSRRSSSGRVACSLQIGTTIEYWTHPGAFRSSITTTLACIAVFGQRRLAQPGRDDRLVLRGRTRRLSQLRRGVEDRRFLLRDEEKAEGASLDADEEPIDLESQPERCHRQ